MGNNQANRKSTKKDIVTELIDVNYADECAEEQYIDKTKCCFLEFEAVKKRKIIWENNFITHCVQIKDEFKWAQEIIDLISQNLRPKGSYFKEVNDLKLDVRVVGEESERQILITPSEVQQFKSNLKQSVLLSASHTNKYYQDSAHKMANTMTTPMRPSKIEFNRFNNPPHRASVTPKKIQRSPSISSSKSGLRKSIMSFVDDTLSSVFGGEREISKQVANNLEVFLKFSMVLQKHFCDPQCVLSLIKRKFIEFITRTYADSVATASKMGDLVDSINQFMTILKEAVIDYYNLNSFADGEPFANPFIANEENILSLCRTIFFKERPFYDTVFNATLKYNEQREKEFTRIFAHLEGAQPELFYVRQKFCLNRKTIDQAARREGSELVHEQGIADTQPYRQCKLILNQLEKSMTPVNKMKIILTCSEMINKEIQKFYDVNALQREKWVLDADQVLAVFCYVIVSAKIEHLHSHLFILDHFSTNSQMISIFGYYLSVMNCAVEQLEGDYLDKIGAEEQQL